MLTGCFGCKVVESLWFFRFGLAHDTHNDTYTTKARVMTRDKPSISENEAQKLENPRQRNNMTKPRCMYAHIHFSNDENKHSPCTPLGGDKPSHKAQPAPPPPPPCISNARHELRPATSNKTTQDVLCCVTWLCCENNGLHRDKMLLIQSCPSGQRCLGKSSPHPCIIVPSRQIDAPFLNAL